MKLLKLICITLIFVGCASSNDKATSTSSTPKLNLPSYDLKELSNGLEVLLIKDTKLPLIQLSLLVPAGTTNDSEKKQGLAYMTGKLLKMGSKKRSANQISESFEQKGSSFSVSVSSDYVIAQASALSKFKNELFHDFTEVITEPKFSWSEYNRLKKKITAQNKKVLDDASHLASAGISKVLYPNHPYGFNSTGTPKTLRSISRNDILKFYKDYYRPNGSTIAIVGDFDQSEVDVFLEKLVKSWPKNMTDKPEVKITDAIDSKSMVHLIHKPEAKQSQIRMGHMGISRNNKDFIALRVANAILGQGFSSRLLTEVRVKKGLTYTVRSSFNASKYKGPFLINTFTRHDKVKETVNTISDTVKLYLKDGITDSELQVAKQYLKGTFPRALETSTSVAYNIMLLKYLGVPLDYLKNYMSDVDKVTKEEVKRVANKYIHPDKLQIVVLSDKSKVESQLKEVGEVKHYSHKDFN